MDTLSSLNEAFSRLVFDQAARARLRQRDWSGLNEETRHALAAINLEELDRLGHAVRRGIETGALGGLGIRASFPKTLASLGVHAGEAAVLDRFLASEHLREVDGVGRQAGVSVAEAFHAWACGELSGNPVARCTLQHELAAALLKTLVHTTAPGFQIRTWLIRPTERGYLCVLDAERPVGDPEDKPGQPFIHACTPGRYCSGRLSPPMIAVLLSATRLPPAWIAPILNGMAPEWRAQALRQLTEKGLL